MDKVGTHFPVLAACVARTSGPVLELGCGEYSTPMLHLLCRNRRLVSIETNPRWFTSFEDLRSASHELLLVKDWASVTVIDENEWGVAFIDHAPAARRVPEIRRLMHRARFIVIHDTEDPIYKYESILPEFTHRYDYKRLTPWTTVVSMFELLVP